MSPFNLCISLLGDNQVINQVGELQGWLECQKSSMDNLACI